MDPSAHLKTQTAREKIEALEKDSIPFRLLSALLEHAPTYGGVDGIATNIVAASAFQGGLEQLAKFYITSLILPMKASHRTTRAWYDDSKNQEILLEAGEIAAGLEIAKRDQKTLKKYALRRDSYRCTVTLSWDLSSLSIPSVNSKYNSATGCRDLDVTEAAHILPLSLLDADPQTVPFSKTKIWDVIESFAGIKYEELNADNLNSLMNVITLTIGAHDFFGSLHLWLEAVPDMPNTYKVKKTHDLFLQKDIKDGTEVTFTSPNPEMLPLPDRRYIAFHAAIAKVVHMAGIAQHLNNIINNYEDERMESDDPDELLPVVHRQFPSFE